MAAIEAYLANLLSGIANARLQADLESVRIAQLYAQHPLLQHLPVPRFRLPTVTLDLPVGIDKVDEPQPAAAADVVHKQLIAVMDETLNQQQLRQPPRSRASAIRSLAMLLGELPAPEARDQLAIGQASERAVGVVMSLVRNSLRSEGTAIEGGIETQLRGRLTEVMRTLLPKPASVRLLVASSDLKAAGPPELLTRIQLTVTEEGVEWTQTRADDPSSRKLVQE
ncbi:hypothetical protein RQP53_15990 [Paucibacter sp. APW11]|uniref:Uncharacterized protein n=1 Tax=Roseateles aquae TaxID=3077235 RepID=A0ABU3PFB0_9BURK|nr:hypothetical protein [Paucibacter sp. APW11]MDT9000778.1 hypothetical protein [Paucibacter sp. APW11]